MKLMIMMLVLMTSSSCKSNQNNLESKFGIQRKNFSKFINVVLEHFDKKYVTYVILENIYTKEILPLIGQHFELVWLKTFQDIPKRKKDINLLVFDRINMYSVTQNSNLLYFIELDDKENRNQTCRDIIGMIKFNFLAIPHHFRSVIFCQNENNEELWVMPLRSNNSCPDPSHENNSKLKPKMEYLFDERTCPEQIQHLSQAYFNQKPNLHHFPVHFKYIKIIDGTMIAKLKPGRMLTIQESICDKLNATFSDDLSSFYIDILLNPDIKIPKRNFYAYKLDTYCFVVHKSSFIPKWQAIPRCFSLTIWLVLFGSSLVTALVWHLIIKPSQTLLQSLTEIIPIFVTFPVIWLHSPIKNKSQIFTGIIILISNVVISRLLLSKLFSNLQDLGRYPPLDTWEDLIRANITFDCKYQVSCEVLFGRTTPDYDFRLFKNDYSIESIKGLWKNYRIKDEQDTFFYIADILHDPSSAVFMSCTDAQFIINRIPKYKDKLHIMKETLDFGFLIFGSDSNKAPFQNYYMQIFKSFLESGLSDWLEFMTEWELSLRESSKENEKPSGRFHPLTLNDLQIAFYSLIFWELLALIVFIFEKRQHRKNPF